MIHLGSRFPLPVVFCLTSGLADLDPTSMGGQKGDPEGEEASFGLNTFCREPMSKYLRLDWK